MIPFLAFWLAVWSFMEARYYTALILLLLIFTDH